MKIRRRKFPSLVTHREREAVSKLLDKLDSLRCSFGECYFETQDVVRIQEHCAKDIANLAYGYARVVLGVDHKKADGLAKYISWSNDRDEYGIGDDGKLERIETRKKWMIYFVQMLKDEAEEEAGI